MTALLLAAASAGALVGVLAALLVAARTGAGRHVRRGDTPRIPHNRPLRSHARRTT